MNIRKKFRHFMIRAHLVKARDLKELREVWPFPYARMDQEPLGMKLTRHMENWNFGRHSLNDPPVR